MAGFIYCIQVGEDGPVKIGYTAKEPALRKKQLQIGSPTKLNLRGEMPGTMEGERLFHEAFAERRLEGEWFTPCPILFRAFEAVSRCNGIPTRPPKTERGCTLLALEPARKVYPDKSRHRDIDWDALAVQVEECATDYERWRHEH